MVRRDWYAIVRLTDWLDEFRAESDLVVLTGGASVGAYDVVRDVITRRAVFRHTIQPGKPQVFGDGPRWSASGQSGVRGRRDLIRPLLDRILGRPAVPWHTAVAGPTGRRPRDDGSAPVTLGTDDSGRLVALPAQWRRPTVTSLAEADGYAMVAEDVAQVRAGDLLSVRWL